MENNCLTPTQFLGILNDTFALQFDSIVIEGEVASFKINQGKWVFFDIKDEESNVSCFMAVWELRMPIEDGMKVVVKGTPKMTKWGKFSFTVSNIKPVGEGSLKKSFELLKKKLEEEGLFNPERKREIPKGLTKIGVISSTQAAGYADFIKILNERWGGLSVKVAHTQVQGLEAPDQIIRALRYFNEHAEVEVIAIIRGGGSMDDLSAFNDERLAREIAASKIPVITGIGHEVDETLADLVADVRASTPSNVAEYLTLDRGAIMTHINYMVNNAGENILRKVNMEKNVQNDKISQIKNVVLTKIANYERELSEKIRLLDALNPEKVLKQGYAILSGDLSLGNVVKITTFKKELKAEIKEINERK